MMLFDSLLYFLLFLYLDRVLPSKVRARARVRARVRVRG